LIYKNIVRCSVLEKTNFNFDAVPQDIKNWIEFVNLKSMGIRINELTEE